MTNDAVQALMLLGSLSFVYFSYAVFLFCPLGDFARSCPISRLTFEPDTSSSVGREDAPLVQAREVAPYSFCSLPSQNCTAYSVKDLYLGGTHVSTFHLRKS